MSIKFAVLRPVVVGELAVWLIPTPKNPSSNPTIWNFNKERFSMFSLYLNKRKEAYLLKNSGLRPFNSFQTFLHSFGPW